MTINDAFKPPYGCRTRKAVSLTECVTIPAGSKAAVFNTHLLASSTSPPKTPSVTQAVSSAEDLPVPPPARHWEVAARANCYKGKGGEPIQPQDAPKWVDSIDACRAE